MAEIFGNTTTTPLNPNAFAGGEGGQDLTNYYTKGETDDKIEIAVNGHNVVTFDTDSPTTHQITAVKSYAGYDLLTHNGEKVVTIVESPINDIEGYKYDPTITRPISCKLFKEIVDNIYTKPEVDEKVSNIELAVIVSELPETATPNKIYMIPKTNTEDANVFDEYLWVNGAWEYIGSIQAQVDLGDYVKKTDYATTGVGGTVRIDAAKGIHITAAGYLQTFPAKKSHIDAKDEYKPIVPSMVDYAVHSAIKDFVTEMSNATTFEQLKTACTNYLNSIS